MASLGSAVLDLTADTSQLDSDLQEADSTTQSRMGGIASTVGKGAAAAGAALAAAGAAAVTSAWQTANLGDELDKTSSRLGVSTDALQDFNYWAEQNGVESSTLERAVGRLNQRVGEAARGNDQYADAFRDLGVDIKDANGDIRDSEAVMGDTIDRLMEIEDPAERASQASEVFGDRVARDLQPALEDGSLTLEEATEAMDGHGRMTEEQIEASARFQDAWHDVTTALQGFMRDAAMPLVEFMGDTLFPFISETILPLLQEFGDAFREDGIAGGISFLQDRMAELGPQILDQLSGWATAFIDWAQETIPDAIASFAESFPDFLANMMGFRADLIETALELFAAIVDGILETLPDLLDAASDILTDTLDLILEFVPDMLDTGIELLMGLIDGLIDALPDLLDTAMNVIDDLLEAILGFLPDLLDAGIELLLSLLEGLLEALPDIIDFVITDLIPSVLQSIWDNLPKILEAGLDLIASLLKGLIQALPDILAWIVTDLIPQVLSSLAELLPKILEFGADAISDMWGGMKDFWSDSLLPWIRDVPGMILDGLGELGSLLAGAGRSIINGLWSGMKDMWRSVTGWVGGLGSQIADLKGPIQVDRRLLTDEGDAIIGGLEESMMDRADHMLGWVGSLGGEIAGQVSVDDAAGGGMDRHELRQIRRLLEGQQRETLVTSLNRVDRLNA